MKFLTMLLMVSVLVLLSGCTTYGINKEVRPDGSSSTVVNVKSTRDIEQPDLHYKRTGKDASFDFSAAGVDNNTDTMLGMFQGMMGMMMQMMEGMMMKMMTMQPPVPQE